MSQPHEISYWMLLAAPVLWCAVMIGLNVISYLFSSSWRTMCHTNTTKNKPQGTKYCWQEMEVGDSYGNVYKFHISPQALFISTCLPFSCWTPVLEIPWKDIKITRDVRLYFKSGYEVEFGTQGAKAKFTKKGVKKWGSYVKIP